MIDSWFPWRYGQNSERFLSGVFFFFFLLVSENPLLVFLPEWQVMCLWGDTSPSFVSPQQGGWGFCSSLRFFWLPGASANLRVHHCQKGPLVFSCSRYHRQCPRPTALAKPRQGGRQHADTLSSAASSSSVLCSVVGKWAAAPWGSVSQMSSSMDNRYLRASSSSGEPGQGWELVLLFFLCCECSFGGMVICTLNARETFYPITMAGCFALVWRESICAFQEWGMALSRTVLCLNAKFLVCPAAAHIFRLIFAWHLNGPKYFTS